jgi:hypothetical protein
MYHHYHGRTLHLSELPGNPESDRRLRKRADAPVAAGTWVAHAASATNPAKVKTLARWYACDTRLEGLAQDLQDVPPELRELIQAAHARVRPRPRARQRDLTAADQPHIRDGMMGGAEGAAGDQGRAPVGEAGDAMHAGRFDGFGQAHLRQDGGQAARQPRSPRARRTHEEDVGVTTPASGSPEHAALDDVPAHGPPPTPPKPARLTALYPEGPA